MLVIQVNYDKIYCRLHTKMKSYDTKCDTNFAITHNINHYKIIKN